MHVSSTNRPGLAGSGRIVANPDRTRTFEFCPCRRLHTRNGMNRSLSQRSGNGNPLNFLATGNAIRNESIHQTANIATQRPRVKRSPTPPVDKCAATLKLRKSKMSADSARTTATPQKINACLKNKKATENPHCKRSERNSTPSAMFNHGLDMRDLGAWSVDSSRPVGNWEVPAA
jgi:hypothetical protein